MKSNLIKSVCGLALAAVSLPSHSALIGRDLDTGIAGFEAYYDTVLDITWLGDANYAKTSRHDADGRMTWNKAVSWADNLSLYGYDDWRLPQIYDNTGALYTGACTPDYCGFNVATTDPANGSPATTVYSEMASLWYDTLGNTAGSLSNKADFKKMQSDAYWFGVKYASIPSHAWNFFSGSQHIGIKHFESYAWAVRSGDVSAVPVPAAVWLLGSGLMGLVGYRRYKR